MSTSNFQNLLKDIQQLNTHEEHQYYVPSCRQYVSFTPLTVKQQKDILSSSVDMKIENLSFANCINKILLTNKRSSDVKLLAMDKPLLVLQMRQHSINNELKLYIGEDETVIDIQKHVESIKKQLDDSKERHTFTVKSGPLLIACEQPDIDRDTLLNKHFTRQIKKQSGNKNETVLLTDVIGDIYIHELIKFIKTITIGENVVNVDIDLSPQQMVDVFESLPLSVCSSLVENVKKARETELLCTSHESLREEDNIPIDATLFTNE